MICFEEIKTEKLSISMEILQYYLIYAQLTL